MSQLSRALSEYNELVREWNDRYGQQCSAMEVDIDKFNNGVKERVAGIFKSEMSERQKISITTTVVGDFARPPKTVPRHDRDGLAKGELAYLIVKNGEKVLEIS